MKASIRHSVELIELGHAHSATSINAIAYTAGLSLEAQVSDFPCIDNVVAMQ